MTILQDIGSETAQLAEIARLRAENEALRAKAQRAASRRVSFKVTDKGAVSVYGLGRFPVTLYKSQWDTLLGVSEDIKQFILDNAAALSVKE